MGGIRSAAGGEENSLFFQWFIKALVTQKYGEKLYVVKKIENEMNEVAFIIALEDIHQKKTGGSTRDKKMKDYVVFLDYAELKGSFDRSTLVDNSQFTALKRRLLATLGFDKASLPGNSSISKSSNWKNYGIIAKSKSYKFYELVFDGELNDDHINDINLLVSLVRSQPQSSSKVCATTKAGPIRKRKRSDSLKSSPNKLKKSCKQEALIPIPESWPALAQNESPVESVEEKLQISAGLVATFHGKYWVTEGSGDIVVTLLLAFPAELLCTFIVPQSVLRDAKSNNYAIFPTKIQFFRYQLSFKETRAKECLFLLEETGHLTSMIVLPEALHGQFSLPAFELASLGNLNKIYDVHVELFRNSTNDVIPEIGQTSACSIDRGIVQVASEPAGLNYTDDNRVLLYKDNQDKIIDEAIFLFSTIDMAVPLDSSIRVQTCIEPEVDNFK